MKNLIVSVVAFATIFRLLVSFVLFPNNSTNIINDGTNNILTQALGQGILPALGAAILDPTHTWNHLEEACFWLDNSPSLWTDSLSGDVGSGISPSSDGYSAIYTPGTRIVAPPLVVAFLGETLVCPKHSSLLLKVLRTLILLIADIVGAYCIYHLGKRILDIENSSNEADMESCTKLSELKSSGSGEKSNDDLLIPGILRPARGWVFDLPSKVLPPEKSLVDGVANNSASDDDKIQKGGVSDSTRSSDTTFDRKPVIIVDQVPIITSLIYFCNPVSMLANATGSLRSLWDAILLLSFYYATMQPTTVSKVGMPMRIPYATKVSVCLALATYADVGYAMFILPILLWRGLYQGVSKPTTIQRAQHHDWKTVLAIYVACLVGMHYFASLLVGGELNAYRKVMVQTMLPNVAFVQQDDSGSVPGPCMGLHW